MSGQGQRQPVRYGKQVLGCVHKRRTTPSLSSDSPVTLPQYSLDLKYMDGYSTSQSESVLHSEKMGAEDRGAWALWAGFPFSSGQGSAFQRKIVLGKPAVGGGCGEEECRFSHKREGVETCPRAIYRTAWQLC